MITTKAVKHFYTDDFLKMQCTYYHCVVRKAKNARKASVFLYFFFFYSSTLCRSNCIGFHSGLFEVALNDIRLTIRRVVLINA